MTKAKAKALNVGDSFRLPSRNGHDTDGFRTYTVIDKAIDHIRVEDVYGYQSSMRFDSPTVREAQ